MESKSRLRPQLTKSNFLDQLRPFQSTAQSAQNEYDESPCQVDALFKYVYPYSCLCFADAWRSFSTESFRVCLRRGLSDLVR